MARKPSVTYDEDAPKLTDAELAEFRPAREVMSEAEFEAATMVKRGRLANAEPKVPVTIRLSRSVVETYKATGKGWQTRINADLEETATRRSVGSGQYVERSSKASPSTTVKESPGGKG